MIIMVSPTPSLSVSPSSHVSRSISSRRLAGVLSSGLLLAGLSTGCATSTPSAGNGTPPAAPRASAGDHVEERALLLLMTDRQLYEPMAVAGALSGDASLRRDAALALGRIGDARGVTPLEGLLGDPSADVRRAAALALGELGEAGHRQAVPSLLDVLDDPDREVGRLAVEALWKHGVDLGTIVGRLIDGPPDELWPRLLPTLYRFDEPGKVRWAEQGLERAAELATAEAGSTGAAEASVLRAWSAYALARDPRPEGAPLLRTLLTDPDPWIRGWAARALARDGIGERVDLGRIRPLLDDTDDGPIIQALRAGKRLVDAGVAPPADAWRGRILELMSDPRPGVRLTAIEASAAWLLDDALATRLLELGRSELARERELALLALAEGEDPRLAVLLGDAAGDARPSVRVAAVRAAGLSADLELLARMLLDPSPFVRRTAIDTLLTAEPPDPTELLTRALADDDVAVRALALGWAAGRHQPVLDLPTLEAAWARASSDLQPDAQIGVVRSLALLAAIGPAGQATDRPVVPDATREAAVRRLQDIARTASWLVRREAVELLERVGAAAPALGAADTGRTIDTYRDIVRRTRRPRQVDLFTERGTVVLELDCPSAPLTCLSFLQLAGQGFYDDQVWHRVVPDFVVQGGDPRGDGDGGPGYQLRDEIGLLRYGPAGSRRAPRHVVGMAHAGAHTAGSQFFVTLSAQPHLDGTYTAFGRVVEGAEVLPRLVQGDRLIRVRERSTPGS